MSRIARSTISRFPEYSDSWSLTRASSAKQQTSPSKSAALTALTNVRPDREAAASGLEEPLGVGSTHRLCLRPLTCYAIEKKCESDESVRWSPNTGSALAVKDAAQMLSRQDFELEQAKRTDRICPAMEMISAWRLSPDGNALDSAIGFGLR